MKKAYYGNYSYMTRVEESRYRRVARARQVKRQKILVILGILITVVMCLFFSVKAFAKTDDGSEEINSKQFKSVMIYCGDTVVSLAEEYYDNSYSSADEMAEEIRSINHLSVEEKLIPGNYIIIPYFEQQPR